MPHRSRVFRTRVLCKKNFTYGGVFNPYSDVLKPYSGVFLQFFFKVSCLEPYSGVFKPYSGVFKHYSDVLNPYSDIFLQFMKIESLKPDFHVNFFLHHTHPLTNQDLKTRVLSWNSSFKHSRC